MPGVEHWISPSTRCRTLVNWMAFTTRSALRDTASLALGTHLGTRLADAILDGTVEELPYAAYDFPGAPLGLYNGKPWFLPLIGVWHRILDLIY